MTAAAATMSLNFDDAYFKSTSQYLVSELTAGYVLDWSALDYINEAGAGNVYANGSYFLITAAGTVYNVEEMKVEFVLTVLDKEGQEFTYRVPEEALADFYVNRSRQPYGKGPGRR